MSVSDSHQLLKHCQLARFVHGLCQAGTCNQHAMSSWHAPPQGPVPSRGRGPLHITTPTLAHLAAPPPTARVVSHT